MKKLIEKKLKSHIAYQGSFLQVLKDEVELPNGKIGSREYIPHPGAAMVIPVTDKGQLVMLHQFRYAVQSVVIEFPAGDSSKAKIYALPLYGDNQDLAVVTLSFKDVNGDNKPDLIVASRAPNGVDGWWQCCLAMATGHFRLP